MFKRGDRVQHSDHGYGQIIEVKSDTDMEVFFQHDKKWATVPTSSLLPMPRPKTALSQMVEKLDNKRPGTNGYIAYRKEIVDILNELSEQVPANVILEPSEFEGEIRVSLRLSFTLERDLL